MTTTTTMTLEIGALKTRLKTTWESGDYGVFAKYLEKGSSEPYARLPYPRYEVLTANGVTEAIEHRRMEPLFYISDDPEVRRELGFAK